MKSKIYYSETELDYPKLRYWKGNKGCSSPDETFIVLFSEPKRGIVVHVGMNDTDWNVGNYHDDWVSAEFSDYFGEIKISN